MTTLLALALLAFATSALAAYLVSQTELPNGKTACVYSDGSSIVSTDGYCPQIK